MIRPLPSAHHCAPTAADKEAPERLTASTCTIFVCHRRLRFRFDGDTSVVQRSRFLPVLSMTSLMVARAGLGGGDGASAGGF